MAMRWRVILAVVMALAIARSTLGLGTPNAYAQPIEGGTLLPDGTVGADASQLDGSEALADAASPEVVALLARVASIAALVRGELAVEVDPASLFEVDLSDEASVRIERARLEWLVRAFESDASVAAPALAKGALKKALSARDAAADAAPDSSQAAPADRLRARLELDRARLSFLSLGPEARASLLDTHKKRQLAVVPKETEAERKAREAEAERQRALARARLAATEAERAISGELARLLAVAREQVVASEKLSRDGERTNTQRELSLRAQRRAREARESATKTSGEEADAAYDEVRKVLRETRDAFETSLAAEGIEAVPSVGKNPLLALGLDSEEVRVLRERVEKEADRLTQIAVAQRDEGLAHLLDDTVALNRERLALIPYLSAPKRESVTGLTAEGRDQAAAELRQLGLLLRYHRHVARGWLREARRANVGGALAANAIFVLFLVSLFGSALVWWRKRAEKLVDAGIAKLREADRASRAATPSHGIAVLSFVRRIRSPFEWLVFVVALDRFLPLSVSSLIEVDVLVVVLTWTFGGRLAVEGLDAVAALGARVRAPVSAETRGLRHESLGLVARVVVVFGVTLVLCARLVGRGAIFEWVLSASWLVAVPVFVVLVRRWRGPVFARLARVRKPNGYERWALAHDRGWASFFAAASAATYLLVLGSVRAVRGWVGQFDVTRRATAYLFQRHLDRLGTEKGAVALGPLPDATVASLGPESHGAADSRVASPNDESIVAIRRRIERREGGVVAIVGERGMGKTTTLRHLGRGLDRVVEVDVVGPRVDELVRALCAASGGEGLGLEEAIATVVATESRVVLLDDAHRLVQPVMGGIAPFDEVLAALAASSSGVVWVLAFDEVVWRFLERARSTRPIFDEICRLETWGEAGIGELLRARSRAVGLEPSFEQLLDALPPDADEVERREALDARAASYDRLLWDHAAGNPGVVLHLWSRSLRTDAAGRVLVIPFHSPDVNDLERLPDTTLFVLRAVLQLAPAEPPAIAAATNLRMAEVNDAIRYALARGYVERDGRGVSVTWAWLRPIVLFLQRRHLLVST